VDCRGERRLGRRTGRQARIWDHGPETPVFVITISGYRGKGHFFGRASFAAGDNYWRGTNVISGRDESKENAVLFRDTRNRKKTTGP